MGEVREKKLYVCLRCGNKFWSRAKKPQCSVCRSKRVVPYEEFLQLPQEEQERILGKRSEEKTESLEATGVKEGEAEGNSVKIEDSPGGERVKGERVKREISIPKPRLSWKAVGIVLGAVFVYYLYKTGWFDSVPEFLGVKEKEEPVKAYGERRSPLLGKIERNLRG